MISETFHSQLHKGLSANMLVLGERWQDCLVEFARMMNYCNYWWWQIKPYLTLRFCAVCECTLGLYIKIWRFVPNIVNWLSSYYYCSAIICSSKKQKMLCVLYILRNFWGNIPVLNWKHCHHSNIPRINVKYICTINIRILFFSSGSALLVTQLWGLHWCEILLSILATLWTLLVS